MCIRDRSTGLRCRCVRSAIVAARGLSPHHVPMIVHLQHSPRFQARCLECVREIVQRTVQGIVEPWAQVPVIHEVLLDGVPPVHQLASAPGRGEVGVDVQLDQDVNPRLAIPT
eukprot:3982282-Alexandrium_andersonii.AAC.1